MADVIMKLNEIEDFFQKLTTQMLGLDPSLPENQDKVRIAWPTKGAPAWKITDDVVFLRVNNIDDLIIQQRNIEYGGTDINDVNRNVSYTRVHLVQWILYGPNSYDNAELIKNNLYMPQYKESLERSNLFLILDIGAPIRSPELYNGQWWERTDFMAKFNEFVKRENVVPAITSTDIKVVTEKGVIE